MIVTNLYTAVGVNRTCNSVDWAHNDLICYAACNSICIFDPFVSFLSHLFFDFNAEFI